MVQCELSQLEQFHITYKNGPTLSDEWRRNEENCVWRLNDVNIEGWSIERDEEKSIELTSKFGNVSVHLAEKRDGWEIWHIDAELTQQGSQSWKIAIESRSELINNILPDILTSQVIKNQYDNSS